MRHPGWRRNSRSKSRLLLAVAAFLAVLYLCVLLAGSDNLAAISHLSETSLAEYLPLLVENDDQLDATPNGTVKRCASRTLPRGIEIEPCPPTAGMFDAELHYDFARTAIFTMAAGNEAARQVIALVHSIRTSRSRVQDIVVMLNRGGGGSPECRGLDGGAWKRAHGRLHVVDCEGA